MIGAMYLDFGYQETSRVVLRLLAKALKTVEVPEASEHDPKSELQQRCQKAFGTPPSYSVKHASGPEHEKVFTVEVAIDGQVLALGEGARRNWPNVMLLGCPHRVEGRGLDFALQPVDALHCLLVSNFPATRTFLKVLEPTATFRINPITI